MTLNLKTFIFCLFITVSAVDLEVKSELEKAIIEKQYKEIKKIIAKQNFNKEEKDYYLELFKQNNKAEKVDKLKVTLGAVMSLGVGYAGFIWMIVNGSRLGSFIEFMATSSAIICTTINGSRMVFNEHKKLKFYEKTLNILNNIKV